MEQEVAPLEATFSSWKGHAMTDVALISCFRLDSLGFNQINFAACCLDFVFEYMYFGFLTFGTT